MNGERDLLRVQGSFDPDAVRAAIDQLDGAEIISIDEAALRLGVEGASRELPRILRVLEDAGAQLRETTLSQPSLESLFIKLTGRELRE